MTRAMLTTQLFAAAAMLLVTVGALPAAAQTFDAAVEAYERGDYATALAGFRNYAEQGNTIAQSNLGFMYANGEGVPKDDAEAVRWYRLAALGDRPADVGTARGPRSTRTTPRPHCGPLLPSQTCPTTRFERSITDPDDEFTARIQVAIDAAPPHPVPRYPPAGLLGAGGAWSCCRGSAGPPADTKRAVTE